MNLDDEKLSVTINNNNISLYFSEGPKETYSLEEFGLDNLSKDELKKEVENRLGKENIKRFLILSGGE